MSPPGARRPAVSLSCLVAATPRTGTWLLSTALHATERVGVPEEYFQASLVPSFKEDWGMAEDAPIGRYVRRAITVSMSDNGVFSTKMHWAQMEWLLGMLRTLPPGDYDTPDHELAARWFPNPRYIHVWRRDTARQAISYYRAVRSARWFVLEGEEDARSAADTALDEVDYLQLRWCEDMLVRHEQKWQRFFAQGGITPFDICYEDFVTDYEATVRGVLDYLPVELPPGYEIPPPAVQKQADGRSEEVLAEYLSRRDDLPPMPENAVWSWAEQKLVVPEEGAAVDPDARPGTIDLPNT